MAHYAEGHQGRGLGVSPGHSGLGARTHWVGAELCRQELS